MRVWHELGGRSTATMMFGHVETLAERIEHLERLRQLQDETGGFTAFICWTFQPDHTDMSAAAGGRCVRVSQDAGRRRLYLDNFPNIQSSWVTQGLKIGQLALLFGANDMGSLMIEENVVAEAGTVHFLTLDQIRAPSRNWASCPGSATSCTNWWTSSRNASPWKRIAAGIRRVLRWAVVSKSARLTASREEVAVTRATTALTPSTVTSAGCVTLAVSLAVA